METPNLDAIIKSLTNNVTHGYIADEGQDILREFKEIKEALNLHDSNKNEVSVCCENCDNLFRPHGWCTGNSVDCGKFRAGN